MSDLRQKAENIMSRTGMDLVELADAVREDCPQSATAVLASIDDGYETPEETLIFNESPPLCDDDIDVDDLPPFFD